MTELLRVKGLDVGYGQILAVRDANLVLPTGKVTAVIGPNGAGKSTLLHAIAGLIPVQAGTIELDGAANSIESMPAHKRLWRGISLVQENKRVFRRMSVEDNLTVAGGRVPKAALLERVSASYEMFPVLRDKRRLPADSLSGGQQQMLAIAQALVPQPQVLMLDEPSAGLAPILVRQVMETLSAVAAEGVAVLLVEQALHEALRIADRLYTLRLGDLTEDAEFVPGTSTKRYDDLYLTRPAPGSHHAK